MCFGFRKKLLKRQEEILSRLDKLEARGNGEVLSAINASIVGITNGVKNNIDTVASNVSDMGKLYEARISEVKEELNRNLTEIRANVEKSLKDVREDNEKQLNAMRGVVEEKLTATLNERLNQTFSVINERLDAVNKNLGEMQALNNGVNDLRKVLTNVKTRGTWGEISLENLLGEILTPSQFIAQQNVSGRKNGEAVDFAVILPGKGEERVYLPIDVKFPLEDYQRLVDGSDRGDLNAMKDASRGLEDAVKKQAKSIKEKYINPPYTTDFAIMYLPIEGLYAEVVRSPGLIEVLQSKYKVIPAGPTTISAILNSLQLGFRTLAIQKSSKEVFDLLVKFKSDFSIFVELIQKAQTQMGTASKTLADATNRTEQIRKKLAKVEGLEEPTEKREEFPPCGAKLIRNEE